MDACMERAGKWFRYRAVGIIIEDGHVLFVKNKEDPYYYSVGGGVHLGETSEDAVRREVLEETGVDYEIDRLVFIHENFFKGSGSLGGMDCHEISFHYLMKPKGRRDFKFNSINNYGLKESVHWLPIDRLDEYIAYPSFYRESLVDIDKHDRVEHIVSID